MRGLSRVLFVTSAVLAAVLPAVLAAAPGTAHAALRAVVIGVDAYQYEIKLSGAVNDARSVAAAIKPLAASLTELTDAEVTRSAVMGAFDRVLADSAPGDTVFISYSGHGGRERVRVSPTTPTGFREFWVMADFDRRAVAELPQHWILSSEIGDFIARARAARVRVVLLADHCYSGKIYRSVGVDSVTVRSIPTLFDPDLTEAERRRPPPRVSELAIAPPPPGFISLAAAPSDTPVAEFRITRTNEVHGALSAAFAYALGDGRRDLDPQGTGRITVGVLAGYIQRAVNGISDGQQLAQLRTGDPEDEVLFEVPPKPLPVVPAPVLPAPVLPAPVLPALAPPARTADPPIALAVMGLADADARALVASIPDTLYEPDPAHARLVWQARPDASRLITGTNLFVSFDMSRDHLAAAVANVRVADALTARATRGALSVAITRAGAAGGAPVFLEREQIHVSVRGLSGPNLAVFNLAADGTVQFLYPDAQDAPIAWPADQIDVITTRVVKPFGGDHLVAVAGSSSLKALIAALRKLDGHADPTAAQRATLAALDHDPTAAVAVTGLFTVPAALRCDPEVIRDATMYQACHGDTQ